MTRPYLVSIQTTRRERKRSLEWLRDEWKVYADDKFADQRPGHDDQLRESGVGPEGWWRNQVLQYWQRAHVLGLDTPLGRQALIKGCAAYHGLVESMMRVYGDPPKPGVPSGEVQ